MPNLSPHPIFLYPAFFFTFTGFRSCVGGGCICNRTNFCSFAPSTFYQAPVAPSAPALPILPTTLYEAPAPTQPAYQLDESNREMVEEKLNAMVDPTYSFKYDEEFSSREESADANGNIKGYSGQILESKKKIEIFCATGVMEGMK